MNTEKLNDWLQLAASTGVLIGLLLVGYELRQDAELTRAQLGSALMSSFDELNRSGQRNAGVIAKSITSPEELTFEEYITLDRYFWEVFTVAILRDDYLVNRGIFDSSEEEMATIFIDLVLSSPYGRAWWAENRHRAYPNLAATIDATASQIERKSYEQRFSDTLNILEQMESQQ